MSLKVRRLGLIMGIEIEKAPFSRGLCGVV
jgi:hypothetical protein